MSMIRMMPQTAVEELWLLMLLFCHVIVPRMLSGDNLLCLLVLFLLLSWLVVLSWTGTASGSCHTSSSCTVLWPVYRIRMCPVFWAVWPPRSVKCNECMKRMNHDSPTMRTFRVLFMAVVVVVTPVPAVVLTGGAVGGQIP
jgi:hypothetical protein